MHSFDLKYRPDIDGLRAIAVLLVLAYHAGLASIGGGYVGVDVFFVISGYLITGVIDREIQEERFSISVFYQRRIRRILPALLVMIAGACVLAYRYLLPSEFVDFARSAVAALLSVSNLYFWEMSGYFEAQSSLLMLLHTWSLGVEEQFYIVLPIFLVAARRFFPARLKGVIAALAVASFGVCVWGTHQDESWAFYWMPMRAWELLVGSLLALGAVPAMRTALWRNAVAVAGVAAILTAGVVYRVNTPFPGVAALLPCLGAAAVIAAGEAGGSYVGRLLSLKPVVFVGLISYSLYLWHWPVIVVVENLRALPDGGLSPRLMKLMVFALSLLIATLSWRYVELPFRNGRFKLAGAPVFKAALGASAAVGVLTGGIILAHGLPGRFSPAALRIAQFDESRDYFRGGVCFISSQYSYAEFAADKCLAVDAHKANYLLLGDSHAAHLWYGLAREFPDINFMQATASGCMPLVTAASFDKARCRRMMDTIYGEFLPAHPVDALLIAARWSHEDIPRIAATMAWAHRHGQRVILVGPMVQYDAPLPRLLANEIREGSAADVAGHRLAQFQRLDEELAAQARDEWHVAYVSLFKTLCPARKCLEYAGDGVPLQFDYGHLTRDGSVVVAGLLKDSDQIR